MWIGLLALAAVLVVPGQAQTQTGSVRVSVRVEGTEKGVAGAHLVLTPSPRCTECLTNDLLDLPTNEEKLLDYLTQLVRARGIVDGPLGTIISRGGITSPTATTDAGGNAVFQGVTPGYYSLSAQHPQYVGGAVKRSDGFAGALRPESIATAVTVDPAHLAPQATLFLSPVASMSGRIKNADGSPGANVSVTLGNIRYDAGHRVFVAATTAQTNAAGEYVLTGVGSADYVLRVLSNSVTARTTYYPGEADLEKATLIFIEPGKTLVGIDITLP